MLLYKLRLVIIGFAIVLVGGMVGYHLIEGWSHFDALWMVIITLTTIGYSEPHPLSEEGRAFTMLLIVVGLGLGWYTVGQLTRYVVEGDLGRDLLARRRRRQMSKLSGHFVVVGFGRLGKEVTEELFHRKMEVVAIDPNEEAFEGTQHLAMRVVGDGGLDEVLEQVALDKARGIAVATGSSAANVFVTLSARQMNPKLTIITRVDEAESAKKALRAGADAVISPYGIGGARMAQGLLRPHAAHFVDQAFRSTHEAFELEDIPIGSVSEYNGPLQNLNVPEKHKVLIVAVRKPDGRLLTATDKATELSPGDIAVVVGQPQDVEGFRLAASGG